MAATKELYLLLICLAIERMSTLGLALASTSETGGFNINMAIAFVSNFVQLCLLAFDDSIKSYLTWDINVCPGNKVLIHAGFLESKKQQIYACFMFERFFMLVFTLYTSFFNDGVIACILVGLETILVINLFSLTFDSKKLAENEEVKQNDHELIGAVVSASKKERLEDDVKVEKAIFEEERKKNEEDRAGREEERNNLAEKLHQVSELGVENHDELLKKEKAIFEVEEELKKTKNKYEEDRAMWEEEMNKLIEKLHQVENHDELLKKEKAIFEEELKKTKKKFEEDQAKWEEEKNNMTGKLHQVNELFELYQKLLHDSDC